MDMLERAEAQARLRKLRLEEDKLALDIRSVARGLSWHGTALEWLKASSVPVAVLSLIVTLFVGVGQISTARRAQEIDHFEKLTTRLVSKERSERLSGISGLQLLVKGPNREWDEQSLLLLVRALGVEGDPIVQNAILGAFSATVTSQVSPYTMKVILHTTVEDNKILTQRLRNQSIARFYRAVRNQTRRYLNLPAVSEALTKDDLVEGNLEVEKLSSEQRESLPKFAERSPFSLLEESEISPVHGLSKLISFLFRSGAELTDLSMIYCEGCDFTRLLLDGMKFENSYLKEAKFAFSSLRGASFDGADLRKVSFYGADLTSAKLRLRHQQFGLEKEALIDLARVSWDTVAELPQLDCADLRGANFGGRPLIWVAIDRPNNYVFSPSDHQVNVWTPDLRRSTIDKTTLFSPLTFAWSAGISPANAMLDEELFLFSLPTSSLTNAITDLRGTTGESPKIRFTFVEAEEKWKPVQSIPWIEQAIAAALVDFHRGTSLEGLSDVVDGKISHLIPANTKPCTTTAVPDEERGLVGITKGGDYPSHTSKTGQSK